MRFLDSMYLPKNNEDPKLILGKNIEDINHILDYLKTRKTEPVFELLINDGKAHRLYFDDDGDIDTDYDSISQEEFKQLEKDRRISNKKKLKTYFKDTEIDLSISSYCGKTVCGSRKISFHYVISNVKGTTEQNKHLASIFGFDTTIYPKKGKQQLFRLGSQHKYAKDKRTRGHRKPKLLTNKDDISKHIIQYDSDDCIVFKPPVNAITDFSTSDSEDTLIINDTETKSISSVDTERDTESIQSISETETDESICPILKQLPKKYVDNYKLWLEVTLYYKQFGNYEDWSRWCKTCPRYSPDWTFKNFQIWESRPMYAGDGKQALYKLINPLSEDRTDKLFKLFNGDINDTDIVNDLIDQFKSYFRVVNYKKDEIFVYNRDTDLWESVVKDYLVCYLSRYWIPELKQLAFIISSEVPGEQDGKVNSKWFGKLEPNVYTKIKQKFINNVNSQGNTKTKNNYIKDFFLRDSIKDEKFKNKLNIEKHILSVKGGKVNLKTKEFSKRVQTDYLSYELDLEYNPEAENEAFEEFILDILTPVGGGCEGHLAAAYLQRYLGYGITGETRAEKILVLMGNGSNGKSKLFSMLQSVLKANVDLVGVWNADIFNENISSNNVNNASPEIAKLYGKRLGFINESKKSTVWGETFKKLVDSGSSLTARELYGASFEFNLSTTFIMCSNEFPNFPIDYCYTRRIDTLELMNRYCDLDKRVPSDIGVNDKPININIINEVCGNIEAKQGILNWLIEGAFDYYGNGLLNIPLSQQKKKENFISGNDWFKNFTITKDKKDFIAVNAVYENINLLTSCRVKKEDLIAKFVESGAKLTRKIVDGKRIPILRYVKDSIENEEPEPELLIIEEGD